MFEELDVQLFEHKVSKYKSGRGRASRKTLKRAKLYNLQKGKCCYCEQEKQFSETTIEHLKPHCEGGTLDVHNIAMSCEPCNNGRPGQLDWLTWKSFVLGELTVAEVLNYVMHNDFEYLERQLIKFKKSDAELLHG